MSREILIIDGKGTEKVIRPIESSTFIDKKTPIVDEESILLHLNESQRLYREMEVGQREATVELKPKYPDLPAFIWLNCDDHLGSKLVDYNAFLRDYNIVRDTPNFFCLSNGDEVDHFMITLGKTANGVYETPITPQQQALLMQSLFKKLDDQDKMVAFSFGNHNQFIRGAGYKFENTWLRNFKCPVLNCGGLIHLKHGSQEYRVAITHQHWGSSRLNITNVAKRFWEHSYPEADIVFIGHTHQKSVEQFGRGDKTIVAIVGGTYKTEDEFALEHGGDRLNNLGGITLALSPDRKEIIPFYSLSEAHHYFSVLREIKGLN